jgi:DNA-binding transcriptional MerR regulator
VTIRAYPAGAAYTADRVVALAGVPLSTLHYWSPRGIWVPSVSSVNVRRWSHSDLLALRLIDWLRGDKPDLRLPRTSIARIRGALVAVERLGDRLRDQPQREGMDGPQRRSGH